MSLIHLAAQPRVLQDSDSGRAVSTLVARRSAVQTWLPGCRTFPCVDDRPGVDGPTRVAMQSPGGDVTLVFLQGSYSSTSVVQAGQGGRWLGMVLLCLLTWVALGRPGPVTCSLGPPWSLLPSRRGPGWLGAAARQRKPSCPAGSCSTSGPVAGWDGGKRQAAGCICFF